jgi:hypothetical protein
MAPMGLAALAIEDLPSARGLGAFMQVGDDRFDGDENRPRRAKRYSCSAAMAF